MVSTADPLSLDDLRDAWPLLDPEERLEAFRCLAREDAEDFFLELAARTQAAVVAAEAPAVARRWLRLLPPDELADVLQEMPAERREAALAALDPAIAHEVRALLAYAEDVAGGLMSPRFARARPEMTVDEAVLYLRRQAGQRLEMIDYVYVLDAAQTLLGVVSLREIFVAPGASLVREIMRTEVRTLAEDLDQEEVARRVGRSGLLALPVVDGAGRLKGIVTVDDVVDVVEEEATEDIHRLGGLAALDAPYLQTGFGRMVRKRAGWLAILFVGEMLTASAMAAYEAEIARAVVLALFVPLIISSGGNSGSQATTLVIRAMALGQVRLRDWFRVIRRELATGLALGGILAAIGLVRILAWQGLFHTYGPEYGRVAATVAASLVGVVAWGTVAGSLLPFVLRRAGLDPASASAPFVATLVDVSGLVIYFTVARIVLL